MTVTVPTQDANVGIPSTWTESITAPVGLPFLSSHPAPLSRSHVVAASQTLAAWTVVGLNSSGKLVPAVVDLVSPANSVKPIGVLAHAVTTTVADEGYGATVYRVGHFNMDRLVWPASFNTDALKLAAFEGVPSPTQIVVGRPATYTP